jgi:hypothetical protein
VGSFGIVKATRRLNFPSSKVQKQEKGTSPSGRLCLVEMSAAKGGGPSIGIDLGTTYSCAAVWRPSHNRVEVIPNDQGNLTTPSCVAFTDAWRLIGDAAMNQAAMNSVNTVFGKTRSDLQLPFYLSFQHQFCRGFVFRSPPSIVFLLVCNNEIFLFPV